MWSVFQAIKRSWLKHFITQLSAIFIMTATYGVALFIILSTNNMKNIFNIWGKVNEVSVYVKDKTSQSELNDLKKYFNQHEIIDSFLYESSEIAAENFKVKFQKMSSGSIDTKNVSQFFPAIYKVKLKDSYIYKAEKNILEGFAATVKEKFKAISEVSYGKVWLRKYERIISGIEGVSWVVVFIIILASLFVSSNVIRTVLFSKKEEIEILEFIGANSIWIYGPHVLNICILSIVSFASAVLINYGIYQFSYNQMSFVLSDLILKELHFLSPASLLTYFIILFSGISIYSIFNISSLMPRNKQKTIIVDASEF